jgi:mono/diheme cytochrome c family protein
LGAAARIGAAPKSARSVALDASGDAWVAGDSGLVRLASGAQVSFERDIAAFMKAHCMSCHNGSSAPMRAFDSYETAKNASAEVVQRLRGDGRPVMPPARAETLKPADYRAVVRWALQGNPQ